MNARFRGALAKGRHLVRSARDKAREFAVVSVTAAPVLAMAQTDPFTDAVTDATTKIGTYGAALVGVAAVGVGFLIAIKYVKKIRGAA